MPMKALALLIPLLLLQGHPGATPEPRDPAWMKRHEGFVAEAGMGGIEVLFMGDSITDGWRKDPQKRIWDERFAPLKAADFGIGGDQYLQNGVNEREEGVRGRGGTPGRYSKSFFIFSSIVRKASTPKKPPERSSATILHAFTLSGPGMALRLR